MPFPILFSPPNQKGAGSLILSVRLSGERSNQMFAELAEWEQVLKDTSLGQPKLPAP